MFTQTVGDPGRGERIAAAVLDDPAARAEVVAPITSSVMSTTGLPPEQQPFVASQVDALLQDPRGAQAFIDPFAGSWARMLGEPDPRPPEFDLAPLVAEFAALTGAAPPVAQQLPVPGVPLPRAELGWMDGVRRGIDAAVVPLALVAAGLFAAAFIIGNRGWVLRRLGAWAFGAGLLWVVVPPLAVWASRRWTPGADAVVAVALDESTDGLLPVALALVVGGVAAFAASFTIPAHRDVAPAPVPAEPPHRVRRERRATSPVPVPAQRHPVEHTREMPVVAPTPPTAAATTRVPTHPQPENPDDLWEYYGS